MKSIKVLIPLLALALVACKKKEYTGRVWFSAPADQAEVISPVHFKMNVSGMALMPAGKPEDGTGHFHILVNKEAMPAGEVIINDEFHKHYGKGQTEDTLDLKPGKYRVTLQFADGAHVSYGPAWSHTISITVKAK